MVKNGKFALYRGRMDETLSSHNLTDEKKLRTLVKDHMLQSLYDKTTDFNDNIVEKRTLEVSNFLEMLRSASESYNAPSQDTHHTSWKLKQDNEDLRVMYREGPVGSPFHSLLVEGYIDAPIDVCLCVSWETALYPRWFPDILVPTFKVIVAKTLQKIRIGEAISLVRVKLSWPLSNREALLQYIEFEYFEGDLVVVLLNSISDPDNIQMETHGFTNEGIPAAGNTVRMDVVGGFALQKVTENRSFFRTIGNLDIKLDFVPPSLINFISRQLIGSGFRFYKKTVASVSDGDEDFSKALHDPLYSRIRQALYSENESENYVRKESNNGEQKIDVENVYRKQEMKMADKNHDSTFFHCYKPISNEIEEEDIKESNGHLSRCLLQCKPATEFVEEEIKGIENGNFFVGKDDAKVDCGSSNLPQVVNFHKDTRTPVPISPQVAKALGTLDKLISVVKDNNLKRQNCRQSGAEIEGGEALSTVGKNAKLVDKQGALVQEIIDDGVNADALRSRNSDLHPSQSASCVISPDPNLTNGNWSKNAPSHGNSPVIVSPVNTEANGIHENKKAVQQKKWRLCCFHLVPGRLVSQS